MATSKESRLTPEQEKAVQAYLKHAFRPIWRYRCGKPQKFYRSSTGSVWCVRNARNVAIAHLGFA